MVLEDVESDNECQQKREAPPKVAASPTPPLPPPPQTANTKPEVREQKESSVEQPPPPPPQQQRPAEDATKFSQEDAETQTGRWTPLIQSIKKEAEDGALATMEER